MRSPAGAGPQRLRPMNFRRHVLPVCVLAVCGGAGYRLLTTEPQPKTQAQTVRSYAVKTVKIAPQDFAITLDSRGTVRPRTSSSLVPEVTGQIVEISPNFRPGGFFEKDEVLVQIDRRDYEAAVVIAESEEARAKTVLEEEKARAAQAIEDWKRLGRTGDPPPLVARQPQVAEATARASAAAASVAQARRSLERTALRAPYPGCVLKKNADIGQVVTSGTSLADVYAVDFAEVELPLSVKQLGYLSLPESYRGEHVPVLAGAPVPTTPAVILRASYGGRDYRWEGSVVRAAGAFDERSRQLSVTAQVADPYGRRSGDLPPLKAGLFVEAEIEGHTLHGVFVLPRGVVRDGREVMLVDAQNKLRRRQVNVVWTTRDHVVATDGLGAGDVVCLTNLPFAVDGTAVKPTAVDLPPVTTLSPFRPATEPVPPPPLTQETGRSKEKSA